MVIKLIERVWLDHRHGVTIIGSLEPLPIPTLDMLEAATCHIPKANKVGHEFLKMFIQNSASFEIKSQRNRIIRWVGEEDGYAECMPCFIVEHINQTIV